LASIGLRKQAIDENGLAKAATGGAVF